MTDEINFIEEPEKEAIVVTPWRILITDDDPEVHVSTRFALKDQLIHGRPLNFIDAYTGAEASNVIENDFSIDFMFLDAVMETDDAGLRCAEYVKNVLKRKIPTIVMRTGFANWELENNKLAYPFIDDYIVKTETSLVKIVDILKKWLPSNVIL